MSEADGVLADWAADFTHRSTAADVLPAHHSSASAAGRAIRTVIISRRAATVNGW